MIPVSRKQRIVLILGVALSVASGAALIWSYSAKRARPSLFSDARGYESALYDEWGRPLASQERPLKALLDPYTLVRNYPSQRTAEVTIDKDGFRGESPTPEMPSAMVLGGSAAFGYGLASDAEALSACLNQQGSSYRFINAGVIGFLSGQELALMVHHLDAFHPSLYVAFDGWNDLLGQMGNRRPMAQHGVNGDYFHALEDWLAEHSKAKYPGLAKIPGLPLRLDPEKSFARIVENYALNLERMADFARSRGARFAVVFQPELGMRIRTPAEEAIWERSRKALLGEVPEFEKRYRELIDSAATRLHAKGIPYLDLEREQEIRESPESVFIDVVHASAAGNRLIAGRIGRFLRAHGLFHRR